jgi:proteasome lid subunit RPN8/RPN11
VTLRLPSEVLLRIRLLAEAAYPEEGVGLLIGHYDSREYRAVDILPLANLSPPESRARRYWVGPEDMLRAEDESDRRGLEVLGVFHSHPDHPAQPSETDLEMALPSFVYVITRVAGGHAQESRAWVLLDARSGFREEAMEALPARREESP